MIRAFQWDLARQVERLDWLCAQLPRYADWGYHELYVHLEDAIAYPSLPGIARGDAYSRRQFARLVDTASRVGIKVVPIVNLLGHTQYLIKVPELRDLNELRHPDGSPQERGQICPVHPRTLEIADKLLHDVRPFCTAGKVHVGLDESFALGRHPLSRREIQRIGLPRHFARYVGRLRDLTRSHGLHMGMWADMLYFLPEAIPLLPTDVAAYEWYYYAFSRRPRVELFNFVESDVGERLRRRNIDYWGCPMNGAFRYEPLPHFSDRLANILSWWKRCHRLGAAGFLITSWEPNRLAMELTTVIDAAAATLWLDGDTTNPRAMLERGFARVFGRSGAKAAAKASLACDRYPFSGYPRWEINERWDVVSRRESMLPYRTEERHFRKLTATALRKAPAIPDPLKFSIVFRWYLAARDLWVRDTQRYVGDKESRGGKITRSSEEFRLAIRTGLSAARAIWARTRFARSRGPNEAILAADLAKLESFREGRPVFGSVWQLCYVVRNTAPAAQLLALEQQLPDGTWASRQACHTIEFQNRSARRRGGLAREHAAPVDWNGNRRDWPRLRFVLRGAGEVQIEQVALVAVHGEIRSKPSSFHLGRQAPKRGFPKLNWSVNQAIVALRF